MNAPVGPGLFPAVEICLSLFQTLEAHPFERCSFGVADARLHFPFAIRILDPTRQSHYVVMRENISKQRVDDGVVNIRNGHSFFQVVENDHFRTTTKPPKPFLMEPGPDACTRSPSQQAYGLPTVAKR